MKRSKNQSRSGKIILSIFFVIFACIGIYDLMLDKITALDDFTAVFLMAILMIASTKYKVDKSTALFTGLIFCFNIIGHLGAYDMSFFHYHFDKVVHISTTFFATLAIISFILSNFKSLKFLHVACIAFCITITFGAVVEMLEYWGFIFIGFGDGYLGFGTGDNSKNFGPWENSSLDTTFNFLGSFLGVLFSYLFILKRKLS